MILIFPLESSVLCTLLRRLQKLFRIHQVIGYLFFLLLLLLLSWMLRSFFTLPIFFLGSPLHLYRQQLPSCPDRIFSSALAARLAVADRLSLQRRCATIKDEDGLNANEEELAYSAKETDDMTVTQRISFFIAHCFKELVDPDRGIDSEPLLVQGFDLDGPRAGLQNSPEASDTHGALPGTLSIGFEGWRSLSR
jgi:hypothetical protein